MSTAGFRAKVLAASANPVGVIAIVKVQEGDIAAGETIRVRAGKATASATIVRVEIMAGGLIGRTRGAAQLGLVLTGVTREEIPVGALVTSGD
jgi:translation elongation factor EF-Tu-like GTPase